MKHKQTKEINDFILGVSQSIIHPSKKIIDELNNKENTIVWLFIHIESLTKLQQRELASTLINIVAKRLVDEGKIESAEKYLNNCNEIFSKIHSNFISAIDPSNENPPTLVFRENLISAVTGDEDRIPSIDLFKNMSEATMIFSLFNSFINMYQKFLQENKLI